MRARIILGLALSAAVFAVSAGHAADQAPAVAVYQAPPMAAVDWTGFYIGVNLGYGQAQARITAPGVNGVTNLNGVMAGGQIGYNWQTGNWILGLEADGQWTDQGVKDVNWFPWFVTARARVGYLVGPMGMIYVTGGGVWADFKAQISLLNLTSEVSHVGWVVGMGVENAINRHWSWKLEYLHFDTDRFNTTLFGVPVLLRLTDDIGRVGINYRF